MGRRTTKAAAVRVAIGRRMQGGVLVALVSLAAMGGTASGLPGTVSDGAVVDVLPDGETSGAEALDLLDGLLPEAAALNDMTAAELEEILSTDEMAWLDGDARLGYTMPGSMFTDPHAAHSAIPQAAGGTTGAPTLARGPFAYSQTFLLHSKPGSNRTIYLDFTGHTIVGTAWNEFFGDGAPIIMEPFSIDSDQATFSNAEQDAIQIAWQRVAEDFAPFNVDVTTEEPTVAQLTRSSVGDLVYGQRTLMTNDLDLYASAACEGCGGVAYVGVFNELDEYYEPALAFTASIGSDPKDIAEVLSHETGHTLGLSHDGRAPFEEYYSGQGAWSPIMGDGSTNPISQWSNGDYASPNNTEDDFAVMAGYGAPLQSDDHGGTTATATPITSSSTAISASGLISARTDVDVLRLTAEAGALSITASPAAMGPNLDIRLDLLNSSGVQIATSNPASTRLSYGTATGLSATINQVVAAGTYYLRVDGVGQGDPLTTGYSDYASVGAYSVTGTRAPDTTAPGAPTIDASVALLNKDSTPNISGTGEPGARVTVRSLSTELCQADVIGTAWACSPTVGQPHGSTPISATQADGAGNVSPATAGSLLLDLVVPAAPVVTGPSSDPTNDSTPTFSGTGETGATVRIRTAASSTLCSVVVTAGSWSCSPSSGLAEGAATLNAVQVDSANNISPSTNAIVVIDLTPPLAPVTAAKVSTDTTPTITGSGEPGASISISLDNVVRCAGIVVPAAGTWSCDVTVAQTTGTHQVSGRQTDRAGNVGPQSANVALSILGKWYEPLTTPARAQDTRNASTADGQYRNLGKRQAGTTTELPIAGRIGVPNTAKIVQLNITADGATASGYLTVFPCGATRPTASSLNFVANETVANSVFVRLGTAGNVCIFTSASVDVLVDVAGHASDGPDGSLTFLPAAVRLADTRPAATIDTRFSNEGKRAAGSTYTIDVTGRAGVPAGAPGVVLNVTVDGSATTEGYLSVFPCGTTPGTSNLNYSPGEPMAAQVLTRLSTAGKVCVYNSSATHVIMDISAYAPAVSTIEFLGQPARLLDSRPAGTIDGAHSGVGVRSGGSVYRLPVSGRGGLPGGTTAVALNVTVVDAAPGNYVTVFPCGTAVPDASNVNAGAPGQAVSNTTIAKLAADGTVCLFTSTSAHLIVDVQGYFVI
jgi:Bacterial Ig-like domain